MKAPLPILLVVALGLVTLPSAESQETKDERLSRFLQKFPDSDGNKDGVLTMEEVRDYKNAVREKQKADLKIAPTHANLRYGPHERNVIDLWLPEGATEPVPLLIYFHGGGFVGGDKSGFNPQPYLDAGIAAASGNYRLVDGDEVLCPTPMEDATRAVQYLKSRAAEWNLDKEKVALSGGSAGAVIVMWIGYRDDMANPDSEDPIERESTRVAALVPLNGPANLDPTWIRENLGGPHHIHGSMPKMFGPQWDTPEGLPRVKESSPWEYVTKDDPPTLLIYGGNSVEVPLPETASTGNLVHHPYFGLQLSKKLEALGVPVEFHYGRDLRGSDSMPQFLWNHFQTDAP